MMIFIRIYSFLRGLIFFFCLQASVYAQTVYSPVSCQAERDRLIAEWTRADQIRWSEVSRSGTQYHQLILEDLRIEAQDSREIDLLMRGPACVNQVVTDVDRRMLSLYMRNGYASSSQVGLTQSDLRSLLGRIRSLCVQPFASRDVDTQTGRQFERRSSLEFNELPDYELILRRELTQLRNHTHDYFLDILDESSHHFLTHDEFSHCEPSGLGWTQCSTNDRRIQRMFSAAWRIETLYSEMVNHLEGRLRREVGDWLFTESRGTFFQQRSTPGFQGGIENNNQSLAEFFSRINILSFSQDVLTSGSRGPNVFNIWNWLDSLLPNRVHSLAYLWNHLMTPETPGDSFWGPSPGYFLSIYLNLNGQNHQIRDPSEFSNYLFDHFLNLPRVTFNSTFRVSDFHGGDSSFEAALEQFFLRLRSLGTDQRIEKRLSLNFLSNLSLLQDPRLKDFFNLTIGEAHQFPWSSSDQERHRAIPELFDDSFEHRELFLSQRDSLERLGQAVVKSYQIIQEVFDSRWVHIYRYLKALQYFYSLGNFYSDLNSQENSQLVSEFGQFLTAYYGYKKEKALLPSSRVNQLRIIFCLRAQEPESRQSRQLCETWNLQHLVEQGRGPQVERELLRVWSRSGGHRYYPTQQEYIEEAQSPQCRRP